MAEKKPAAQTNGSEQTRPSEATYVVQQAAAITEDGWIDIATVTVPARTHRAKIIGAAIAQSGVKPEPGKPLSLRVLDAASARVTEVAIVQPEPQLRIG